MKILFFLFGVVILFSSCLNMLYSTGANLPVELMKKNEFDLKINLAYLPETRSDSDCRIGPRDGCLKPENSLYDMGDMSLGVTAIASYAFRDNFNMRFKYWSSLEDVIYRADGGFSFGAQFIKPYDKRSNFVFQEEAGLSFGANSFGIGVGSSILFHTKQTDRFSYYYGFGGMYGELSAKIRTNRLREKRKTNGFGILGYLGGSVKLSPSFWINLEIDPIQQFNRFDRTYQFIITPQIGIGYTFYKKEKLNFLKTIAD